MGELLWTFEDVVPFIDHPDQSLRLWALERLLKRFPNQAASPLAAMLEDPYPYIALKAAKFIAQTGDLEYGPLLLNRFQHAHAPYNGYTRIAISQPAPEIDEALWAGLDDHHADVRFATADLILSAYLDARRKVPQSVVDRLEEMARSDPDKHVRRRCKSFLREPWVDGEIDEAENNG